MNVFIKTFGCQMNEAESSSLIDTLIKNELSVVEDISLADFVVCNTCSVRYSAEQRAEGFISQIKSKARRGCKIILCGCMVTTSQETLKKKFPNIDYFVSNNDKDKIIDIINQNIDLSQLNKKNYTFEKSYFKPGNVYSYVPIQNGCNNFCSYCVVPYTRGREISRDNEQIIDEIIRLDSMGVKVLTLLGQNVNSYNFNGFLFKDLVRVVDELDLKNIKWIYFESPHIKDFNLELLDIFANSKYFAKYFHIPVQSFSTNVLKTMNRRETSEEIYNFFDLIKKKIPGVQLTTDLMVGFPTESIEDYEQTLEGVRKVKFIDAFMYYYNPRKGTAAFDKYKDLDITVKNERLSKLIDVQRDISYKLRENMLGREVEVVAYSHSRKENDKILCYTQERCAVLVKSDEISIGKIKKVKLNKLVGSTFIA